MNNISTKEKLISQLVEMKYGIEFQISELNLDNTDMKTIEKFLFEELSEGLIGLQYRFDELIDEETEVSNVHSSTTVDNWRITNPQEIDRINKMFDSHHVFFEIERIETVEVQARSISEHIQVIGDGKHKYHVSDDSAIKVLESLTDREPDIQYTPAKK